MDELIKEIKGIAYGGIAASTHPTLSRIAADAAYHADVLHKCCLLTGENTDTIAAWAHRYPNNIDQFYRWIRAGNRY
jgi:hypothetical protein